jgi:uncharacterized protein (TIGR04255 family)
VGSRLRNAPLGEAIVELKWNLTQSSGMNPIMKIDPDYNLLVGRISEKLSPEYPFYERLPSASMPDELAGYVVQHRFRKEQNKWPLVQIGPGIITLNETENYDWSDFEKRVKDLINTFFISYPNPKKLNICELTLRYIDGIFLDYEKENALNFIKEKMKIDIKIPESLFNKTNVRDFPLGLDIRLVYPYSDKNSSASIRLVLGNRYNRNALIWETLVNTKNKKEIQKKEDIFTWVNNSHTLTHTWFEKLCEGPLMESFK